MVGGEENIKNRGFLKSEPEASESERPAKRGEGERFRIVIPLWRSLFFL